MNRMNKIGIFCLSGRKTEGDPNRVRRTTSLKVDDNLSQFRPSGAEAPKGRRPETEKRSGRSCPILSVFTVSSVREMIFS
jgi:hypothetical protein